MNEGRQRTIWVSINGAIGYAEGLDASCNRSKGASDAGASIDVLLKAETVTFALVWKGTGDAASVGSSIRQLKAFVRIGGSVRRLRTLVPIVAVPFMGETGRRVKDPLFALEAWREAYDFERHDVRRGHVAVRDPEAPGR